MTLVFFWAVLGKRVASTLPALASVWRSYEELAIDEDTASLTVRMSAATIDRRSAPEGKNHEPKGRSLTKPLFNLGRATQQEV